MVALPLWETLRVWFNLTTPLICQIPRLDEQDKEYYLLHSRNLDLTVRNRKELIAVLLYCEMFWFLTSKGIFRYLPHFRTTTPISLSLDVDDSKSSVP